MTKFSFAWLSPGLTWLGKKLGIDAHYFFKGSALTLLSNGVSTIRGILTGYVVARLFLPELYGQYQFMVSVVGMLTLFGLPGLTQAVTRAWARDEQFSLRAVTRWQLRICAIGSLILLLSIPFLAHYNRSELWPLFIAAAILFPLPHLTSVLFGGFTIGKARFTTALQANIVWSSLMIVATLAIVLWWPSALLLLIANLVIPPVVYLLFCRKMLPRTQENADSTKGIVRYGFQLTLSSLPVDMVWYLDKILISHFFGLPQLAVFSVAILIPEQVKVFTKQLLPVAFSRQAAGDDSVARRRHLLKAVFIGTIIFGIGIAIYCLLSPWFLPWLFPNYAHTEIVWLSNIAACILITAPGALLTQHLTAQGMVRAVQYSHWIAAALFLVALLICLPQFGLVGALIARGVFRFTLILCAVYFICRSPVDAQ